MDSLLGHTSDSIAVRGLAPSATPQTLQDYFSQYGEMINIDCKLDPTSATIRGLAHIQFQDSGSVALCLVDNPHYIADRLVEVTALTGHQGVSDRGGTRTDGGPRSATLCRHFLYGKCTFGATCSFLHDETALLAVMEAGSATAVFGSAVAKGAGSLCKHFIRGRCDRGSSCNFRHEQDGAPTPVMNPPQLDPAYGFANGLGMFGGVGDTSGGNGPSGSDAWISGGHGANSNEAAFDMNSIVQNLHGQGARSPSRFSNSPTVVSTSEWSGGVASRMALALGSPGLKGSPGPCRHYAMGRCTYGGACQFTHDGEVNLSAPGVSILQAGLMRKARSATPCKHFMAGKCTFGDECGFTHSDASAFPLAAAPQMQDMFLAPAQVSAVNFVGAFEVKGACRHFLQGKCTYGDACQFAHTLSGDLTGLSAGASAQFATAGSNVQFAPY